MKIWFSGIKINIHLRDMRKVIVEITKGEKKKIKKSLSSYLQKQLKKISKWLMFVETEITFLGLLVVSCALMNLTMNK